MTIDELMSGPRTPEAGQALVEWVAELRGRIARGDMMIGILSTDEALRAPVALRIAADCGAPVALIDLAAWLAQPPFGERDLAGAQDALRRAMAAGVPGAERRFVELQWYHRREDASRDERREAYEMASAIVARDPQGADGLYLLGLLTCEGFGTRADPRAACALHVQAAALGDANAAFEASIYHLNGIGTKPNSAAAFDYLRQAADAGHARAMYNLAAFHATGQGIAKDLAKAVEWYTRASEAGSVRATSTLAVMYARGEGVARDLDRAEELFDEAESMGADVAEMRSAVGL